MERFRIVSGARSDSHVCIDSLDKYIFHRNGVVRGITRYRCSRYLTRRCTASLTCNEQGVFSTNGFHNHEDDQLEIIKFEFMDWCRQQAANTNVPLHTIYMSALRRFPGRPPVQFVGIRSTLYRARQQNVPVNPRNAQHFADLINANQRYRMDLNAVNQFFFGRVVAGDGEALVFVNVGTLPAFIDSHEMHMDGTFHATPRGFYQLASLHAVSYGMKNPND
ncbi:hypothetical protein OUZ56_028747 [Daphnia magna]|uniref:FLYWCH-type domain-containing protein n=1 Tax=Daphnia magna TaxID=35525 RepID=A0ABR0B4T9_9CRUS|nr:hypothetical protein OUZ56_032025 [Daphnia magna]KAK4036706.1 hypothetical protein OUZ56_028747 [Daphnia magna]